MASLTSTKDDNESFFSPLSQRFVLADKKKRGLFDVMHQRYSDFSANIFAVWNTDFASRLKHQLNITVGGNIQATNSDADGYVATGILSDKADHVSLATAFTEGSSPVGNRDKAHLMGFYISGQYVYNNRYFVDLSFRREGSSKYGTNERYASFGVVGLGWNVHNENFMRKLKFVDRLKLRTSWGVVGNINFDPYQARQTYRYRSDLIYNTDLGAMPVALANEDLKWERTTKRNLGLDFAFAKERISGSVDLYHNTTNNLVLTVAKPGHLGFLNVKENIGKIVNKGVEVALRAKLIDGRDLSLSLYGNMSHNQNRIVKISDFLKNRNKENEAKTDKRLPSTVYEEGGSLTALKVMVSRGINPADGKEIYVKRNGQQTYVYDYNERVIVGDLTPTVQGTFGLFAYYKGVSLSASFAYRMGAMVYNNTLATKVEGADPLTNVDERVLYSRWKKAGDVSLFRHIALQGTTLPTSRFVGREYALEGNSLMIAYGLAEKWCKRWKVRTARLSFSLGQFFWLSTIKRERGLTYPFSRIYELGLNISI